MLGEGKRSSTAVFYKNLGLHLRMIGVCGYGYIHGYPQKICGLWIWIWMG